MYISKKKKKKLNKHNSSKVVGFGRLFDFNVYKLFHKFDIKTARGVDSLDVDSHSVDSHGEDTQVKTIVK